MKKEVKLIFTEERVGEGTDKDPVRIVQQLWTKDGKLVADCDSYNGKSFFKGIDLFNDKLD